MKLRNIWTFLFPMAGTVSTMNGQDFTIHFKTDNGADATTYYVSPNAIRKMSPGLNDVIDRMDRGTIIYLDHLTKN